MSRPLLQGESKKAETKLASKVLKEELYEGVEPLRAALSNADG